MRKVWTIIAAIGWAVAALAQTPQEIIARMEDEMNKHMDEGLIMTVTTKMPLVGTVSMKNYTLGSKMRSESTLMGMDVTIFNDGTTEWTYIPKANKVKIEDADIDSADATEGGDEELFSGITEGYDVTLTKETADAWYFTCKKMKTNTEKDAPKSMELVVSKGTYYPKLLKAKVSGVALSLSDVSFGVKEPFVTFNLSDYPGATVEDNRGKGKKK